MDRTENSRGDALPKGRTGRSWNGEALFKAGQDIARRGLDTRPSPEVFLSMMREGYSLAEAAMARLSGAGNHGKLACGPGCHYCCNVQVLVSPLEALAQALRAEAKLTGREMGALRQRLRSALALARDLPREELDRWRRIMNCVLLQRRGCLLYGVRPFVCRGWHSLNKQDCIRAYHSGNMRNMVELMPTRRGLPEQVGQGLSFGAKAKGLDTEYRYLPQALETIFSIGPSRALDMWLAGEAFPGTDQGGKSSPVLAGLPDLV